MKNKLYLYPEFDPKSQEPAFWLTTNELVREIKIQQFSSLIGTILKQGELTGMDPDTRKDLLRYVELSKTLCKTEIDLDDLDHLVIQSERISAFRKVIESESEREYSSLEEYDLAH